METYAVDFETFYDQKGGYSLKKQTVYDYVHHELFDAYLVAIVGTDGLIYSGPPEKAPWDEIQGHTWISHNMSFDYQVYQRLVDLGKIEPLYPEEWHCTANMVAYFQSPRALQTACYALLGEEISKEVREAMAGVSYYDLTPSEKKEWDKYAIDDSRYCLQLWEKYSPEWPEVERALSLSTIMQGIQGVNIDKERLDSGIKSLNDELFDLAQTLPWRKEYALLSKKGVEKECERLGIKPPSSMAKDDPRFDKWMERNKHLDLPWVENLGKIRSYNKALKFLETVKSRIRDDGNMYFATKYFGAAATGRWSGETGLNMQNLTKNPVFGVEMRKLFIPRRDKLFIISDLSQIEPRALNWMVGNEVFLNFVRSGADCYEAHARASMGYTDKRPLKDVDTKMRQYAKARVLGAGYGASGPRFVEIAKIMAGLEISTKEACQVVAAFRKSNPLIVGMWNQLDRAFRRTRPGKTLEIELASGRVVNYFNCDGESASITKGSPQTRRFWGSKLTENITQATARDVLGFHWVLLAEQGFDVLWNVHDELIIEVDESTAEEDLKTITEIMSTCPDWLEGCPIACEAHITTEYCK